jgi:hypothetical protein
MKIEYVRELYWFNEKISENYIGEEEISSLEVDFLKGALHIEEDEEDPELLYGVYDVSKEHIHKLQPYIKHPIDTEKYDYQIGCHSKD